MASTFLSFFFAALTQRTKQEHCKVSEDTLVFLEVHVHFTRKKGINRVVDYLLWGRITLAQIFLYRFFT